MKISVLIFLLACCFQVAVAWRSKDIADLTVLENIPPRNALKAEKPWFCHTLDCPNYKIVNRTQDYETRIYENGIWASTKVESHAYALAVPIGFRRLFNYISGKNKDGVEIPMTSPVLVKITPSNGPFCKSNFTISFFMPHELHKSPPKPLDRTIFIHETPSTLVHVIERGGYKMEGFSIARMAEELSSSLDRDNIPYKDDFYYFAGYDPPFRYKNRHNEVWIYGSESMVHDVGQYSI